MQLWSNLSAIFITLASVLAGCPQQHVWYVAPEGTGDGSSWENACGSIQEAVDAAAKTKKGGDVWVAQGMYLATDPEAPAVLTMAEGVNLYGGFLGTETALEERNWDENRTIIDGEHDRVVVIGANNATLDGFRIQNGKAFAQENGCGGGMRNIQVSPTVANCIFFHNAAEEMGGGMFNQESEIVLTKCRFINNHAANGGGGMYNLDASVEALNCVFNSNTTHAEGAGMYNQNGNAWLNGCLFSNNITDTGSGGGLCNRDGYASLTYCTFGNNTAQFNGGGLSNGNADVEVTGCIFADNSTTDSRGGAIDNYHSTVSIVNCLLIGNTSALGGAIGNYVSSPSIVNCTITGNGAALMGGGVYNCFGSSPAILNCILWNNAATNDGNEIYDLADDTSPSVSSVAYSCVMDGWPGDQNITGDPMFVDPGNYDYQLSDQSPCIDAGTPVSAPSNDIQVRHRPMRNGYDIGAYEMPPSGL